MAAPRVPVSQPSNLIGKGTAEAAPVTFDPDAPATVFFTSGSTGTPKGVLHMWRAHLFNALASNANIPLEPGDAWLLSLPFYHIGGFAPVMRCLLAGATMVLGRTGKAEIDVREPGITHASLVSTQLLRLLDGGRSPGGMKAILLGGSALPLTLIRRALEAGLPIHTSYGMTEAASQITTTPPGASLDDLATSGRSLIYSEVRISGEGEILVRGRIRFEGYLRPDGLIAPFDADGWFATGDLGRFDSKGRLIVEGRRDNQFVSGGENIHPEAIERALIEHPEVRRAVVVPVSDPEFGQRPVSFVDAGSSLPAPGQLRSWLAGRLPRFMLPVAFYPWPSGQEDGMKINRPAMTALAERLRGG